MTNPSTDLVIWEGDESPLRSPSTLTDKELDYAISDLMADLTVSWRHTLEQGWILGQYLTERKHRLKHGEWLPYIEEHLPFGADQTERLMSLGKADSAFMRNLPMGTTVTEAVKLWARSQRVPRPVRVVGAEADGEATQRPLLRFCGPEWSTGAIVKSIVLVSFPGARMALDVTYGSGNFWSDGAPLPVKGHDLDETRAPDGVMDFTDLKYDDATWDIVLFDPPHLADGGEDAVMAGRFGTVATQEALDNLIIEGVRECWRVCTMGLIVKVTNHVHAQAFQYEQGLVEEALDWKIPYFDLVYQVRDHAFIDPSWGPQRSAYNNGSVYVILKKGSQLHV